MAFQKFEGCCCCLDLKTGVMVIGILGIVLNVGGLIEAPIAYNNACSGNRTVENNRICAKASSQLGTSMSGEVVGIILMALTIYGSQTENHKLMMPIIIVQAVGLVIAFIISWYIIVTFFMISTGYGFLTLFIGNLVVAIAVYLWLVIYSRYQEVKNLSYAEADSP